MRFTVEVLDGRGEATGRLAGCGLSEAARHAGEVSGRGEAFALWLVTKEVGSGRVPNVFIAGARGFRGVRVVREREERAA